jgi:hypothetical protein
LGEAEHRDAIANAVGCPKGAEPKHGCWHARALIRCLRTTLAVRKRVRATRRASPISLTDARYRARQGSAGVVASREMRRWIRRPPCDLTWTCTGQESVRLRRIGRSGRKMYQAVL